MISLQHDPYKNFITSNTPVGLYVRQKWIGQEKDREWQYAFDRCAASLLEGQLKDGSWDMSFIRTVHRLFGLHLTVRHPTGAVERALDWLLEKTMLYDEIKDTCYTENDLRGLPFVPGDGRLLCSGMLLFLSAVFGRDNTPEVITMYEELSRQSLKNSEGWSSNHGDINNMLRAFVVHPVFMNDPSTTYAVEALLHVQNESGKWPDSVPFYKTVNALAHLSIPQSDTQLEKAFTLLACTQNTDGTWGDDEKEWNTFLALHALRNKKLLK
jgi:hypothetical protein